MFSRCRSVAPLLSLLISGAAVGAETSSDQYNWFREDAITAFTDGQPFAYCPRTAPEEATCRMDFQINLGVIRSDEIAAIDTNDVQSGIVRVADAVGLEYAVLTSEGWIRVGNGGIVPDVCVNEEDSAVTKVTAVFDYAATPTKVRYLVDDLVLTNAAGVSSFDCAVQKPSVSSVVSAGEGAIDFWAGRYEVAASDVQDVASNAVVELAVSLDTLSNETFRVAGGGTLIVPSDKIPPGGVDRKLRVDANSTLKFDLSGLSSESGIPSVVKLFNGVGDSFVIGANLKLVVPGEGTERLSKLFVKDGNLEARVAERPSVAEGESSEPPFRAPSGDATSASASVGNAVEGFWYGLETTGLLGVDFALDQDSVRQCEKTGPLTLESSANAHSDAGFYRVSVSAEKP